MSKVKKVIFIMLLVAILNIGAGAAFAASPQVSCSNLKPMTAVFLNCSEVVQSGYLNTTTLDTTVHNLFFMPETFKGAPAINPFDKLRKDILNLVSWASQKVGLSPALVGAVAQAESGGNPAAVSQVGAIGVMQLMPDTAAALGVNPYNPEQNILGGAKYLRNQIDHFNGDIPKALAAYNAGPGAVEQHGGIPPYKETREFVAKVMILAGGSQKN